MQSSLYILQYLDRRLRFQHKIKSEKCELAGSFSDWNKTRTHSSLIRKRTLNYLAKLPDLAKSLSVCLPTKWLWDRIPLQSLKFQILLQSRARISLAFRQLNVASV